MSFYLFYNMDIHEYIKYDWIFHLSSLLIIPTFYLYVLSVSKCSVHRISSFVHYLPAATYMAIYLFLYNSASKEELVTYMSHFMFSKGRPQFGFDTVSEMMTSLFFLNRIVFMFQSIFYIIMSFRLIKNYRERIEQVYSNLEHRNLRWINIISISIIALIVFSVFFNVIGKIYFSQSPSFRMIPSVIFASVFYLIGHVSSHNDFTVYDLEIEEKKLSEIESKIENVQTSVMQQRLEKIMNDKQLFLMPDLRITTLCKELNTNRTYLSQVLNEELNENFNSYVNKFRVNHAINILANQDSKLYSLEQISDLSGFGSSVSMVRAFKQTVGKTPSEFRK